MTPRLPVPIAQRQNRLPEAGRIRIGVKTERAMKAIGTFRFTSHRKEDLEQIAAIYGGTVRPWSDPKAAGGQHEVITEASEIAVALPPDPLGGSPSYRLYGGGGPERTCDGVTCERWRKGPEGPEPYEVDCICAAEGRLECDVTTMLSVLIPEIRLSGTWRIVTKSTNAAAELPGMVALVSELQGRGLALGTLAIEERRETRAGETRIFKVPVLGTSATVHEITAGAGVLGAALPAAERPALASGGGEPVGSVRPQSAPAAPSGAPDDEVVDAEIVEPGGEHVDNREVRVAPGVGTTPGSTDLQDLHDLIDKTKGLGPSKVLRRARELAEEMSLPLPSAFDDLEPGPLLDALYADLDPDDDGGPPSGGGTPAPVPDGGGTDARGREPASAEATQQALVARIAAMFPGVGRQDHDDRRHAVVAYATQGRTTSSKECTKDELLAAHRVLDGIEGGSLVLGLFAESGGYAVLAAEEAA